MGTALGADRRCLVSAEAQVLGLDTGLEGAGYGECGGGLGPGLKYFYRSPRLLLFSPSVVNLGVPLSVGLQLQDAPPGQQVKGSVYLRNQNGRICTPKKDFVLSSGNCFVLLSLEVTSAHSPAVS